MAEGALVYFDQARSALAKAATVDEVKSIRDKAAAMRLYLKQSGESHEMQNRCAEIKIRAERRMGELLREMEKAKASPGNQRTGKVDRFHDGTGPRETLSELGITRNQSSRCQMLCEIPESELDSRISDVFQSGGELTSKAALSWAKELRNGEKHSALARCKVHDLDALAEAGTFQTIYADPPWRYGNQATRAATDNHYPTLSVEDICRLNVAALAAESCLLFLWTTNGFLCEALTQVIPAWGFTYRGLWVWHKPQIGLGNYGRLCHELLLIANTGGIKPDAKDQPSVITHDRLKHSQKPNVFRQIIEKVSPGPRIELFARQAFPGWESWGNEVGRSLFEEVSP